MVEGFSQKLAGTGTGTNASTLMGDVKLPANLNDSDLFSGMQELPKETDRATEMMFFLIRCHVGEFLKRFETPHAGFDGVWNKLTTMTVDVDTKDKAIGDLERLFEGKFLRHCDASIVWHLMCSHLAKSIIFMMRFMAHGASYQGKTETQAEKDALFTLALRVCSSLNLAYTMKEMQGFVWHVNMHFQWKAFVFVLSELRHRTSGSEVEQAWKDVQLTYEFHPTFDEELAKRALPIAVSNLTLKAWDAFVATNGCRDDGEPYFIQLIRHRQVRTQKSTTLSGTSTNLTAGTRPFSTDIHTHIDAFNNFQWNQADLNASIGIPSGVQELVSLDFSEDMNWSNWNDLIVDLQTNNTEVVQPDPSLFDLGV